MADVKHQLNCAKLRPHPPQDPAFPCSCGAEVHLVHNHGPEDGKGWNCRETVQDGKLYGECTRPEAKPDTNPRTDPDWERTPGVQAETWDAAVERGAVPPVTSESFGVELARWWQGKSSEEVSALVGKAQEYGGAHRASDLTQLGRTLAELLGREGLNEGELQELACYFYLQGKLGRWQAALLEGRQVSDDTLHDILVYTRMVQRIREKGGWPV